MSIDLTKYLCKSSKFFFKTKNKVLALSVYQGLLTAYNLIFIICFSKNVLFTPKSASFIFAQMSDQNVPLCVCTWRRTQTFHVQRFAQDCRYNLIGLLISFQPQIFSYGTIIINTSSMETSFFGKLKTKLKFFLIKYETIRFFSLYYFP